MPITCSLGRDAFRKLVFIDAQRLAHVGVVPVSAFPHTAPQESISVLSIDGHELLWVARQQRTSSALIKAELASREFMPEVLRIMHVSTLPTPTQWQIDTDRGAGELMPRGEEDIRRASSGAVLIADSHGEHYLIRDRQALGRHSRRLVDRFL